MSFYNTGNPVPSIDPRDLDDNAKHIDELVNSTFPTFVDRLGTTRRTLAGIEADADAIVLRDELAAANGAALVTFSPLGAGHLDRPIQTKTREYDISVKDFGAIGDGTSHPVSEWYTIGFAAYRGYANLAAVQVDYPFVTSGADLIDWAAIEAALIAGAGKSVGFPLSSGEYIKDRANRIRANTHLVFDPGTVVKRVGNLDSWMFVNGEIGNTTYATGYLGDGNIRVTGGTFDLGGIPGVRTSAAFVMGHSIGLVWEYCVFKNGWESHNIEINASTDALFFKCTFQDQTFAGSGSYECINIDSANAAGFPGFGTYDLTVDKNIIVAFCTFRNVYGGVSSHGIAVGAAHHSRLIVVENTFENIAKKAVRMQGWDDSFVCRNHFINIGEEAITVLTGNRNTITGNNISGASTSVNAQFSAIRIDGDENKAKDNIIKDGGYANKFPYSYGVAAGNRNEIGTTGAAKGTSNFYTDAGTLTMIDGHVLLFSGSASGAATVVTLLDSLNNYEHIEVSTGAVTGGLYQSAIARPFARRAWAVGTDYVAVTTASGRFVASVTSLTSLTITSSSDAVRHIYGVAA